MKLMNSDTHSCTHSLASFAIFAVGGTAFFMIRETFAICKFGLVFLCFAAAAMMVMMMVAAVAVKTR
jgi:hypothetical protein